MLFRVDSGSPSEEAGLQVGDQIMDVNGHNFVSIFHQEAVYILRSYPTLIMTIKVSMICVMLHRINILIVVVPPPPKLVLLLYTVPVYAFFFVFQSLGRIPTLAPLENNTEGKGWRNIN